GRVTRFLATICWDNRVPPHIRRRFAHLRLFLPHKTGRHVWDAVDRAEIERVVAWVEGVPENGVVLGGPAILRTAAVVVSPNDLVDEAVASKEAIQSDLDVVDLAKIEVHE